MTKYYPNINSIKGLQKTLKEELFALKLLIKQDIISCLEKNGFKNNNPCQSIGSPTHFHEKNNIICLDYRYIYSKHVHILVLTKEENDRYYGAIGYIKWYFEKMDFDEFYEKKLKRIVEKIENNERIEKDYKNMILI